MSSKERMYLISFQEISKAISSTLSVREILNLVVRKVTEVMNLKGCTIRMVDPKTSTLELVASFGLSEKYLHKGRVDMDKSISEALSGRPVAIYDATTDPRIQYPLEAKEEGIATLVAIPILVKGKVIGVMRMLTAEPREFLMDEIDFAGAVAELGGQALINAEMYESKLKELEFLKGLQQVVKAINSSLEVQKVLSLMVKTATNALDIKAAAVRLLDEKRKQMALVAHFGLSDRYINKGPVETDQSITEAMTGKAVIMYDVASDPRANYPQAAAEEGIKSIISIPIALKGNVVGVLRLYTSEPRSFSEEEIMFMTSLAEQAALALENARMYQKLKQEHEELMSDLYRFSGFTRSI
ncbi:GAF domain-containing protein [Desulfobacca acetoxidans]|uniref:Putative phytochrome sensor protein n=1 Tax=Desulfobacca acetoxidans (strain ATCC 700848 / DSM 11109 / ASRB2) TaxID=880072 RepID=F2NDZ4_DESAR|nr:GAF domain-containing protein [Desulfobacca acetoxidans]AEB10562.1 putative phytochrome sensor protein [Desulfobacca acetoxidans DSM 11109]HAY21798.1 GAF domain-containing protein [Desulfobacterales bacterium]